MARKPDPKTSLNAVLAIGGMTCEHCERRVREALEAGRLDCGVARLARGRERLWIMALAVVAAPGIHHKL